MARKKGSTYQSKVRQLSSGLFNTLTDVCLFIVFFHLQSIKVGTGRKSISRAIDDAVHLTKIVHAHNLDRLIYRLKNKGYLQKKKDYLKITKLGKERLAGILSEYEEERPWDGILYLITYDIPEEKKKKRNILRGFLKKLGCGMLQRSVWLTPYNPKGIISDFVKERKLAGLVLVSELKEGSKIGGKDILTVVERVYRLDEINERYRKFIEEVKLGKLRGFQLLATYLSILKKDPQLPFELLPPDWRGKEAYRLFKNEREKRKVRHKKLEEKLEKQK